MGSTTSSPRTSCTARPKHGHGAQCMWKGCAHHQRKLRTWAAIVQWVGFDRQREHFSWLQRGSSLESSAEDGCTYSSQAFGAVLGNKRRECDVRPSSKGAPQCNRFHGRVFCEKKK